ncbi:MAG: beta strand repeat-containing protein, partial [Pirellulales bacterium]
QVTFIPEDGTSDTVSTLTVSNSADLVTNGYQIIALTQTTIDGAGTTIRIDPHATPGTAAFETANLDLNNGGGLTMSGGIASVSTQLEINAGSVLGGHGTVNVGDADAVVEQAFENSALLQPQGNTAAPQTLTIHANGVDTIDLDGDSETGIVDVNNALVNVNADTVTLVIDGPLADPFGGGASSSQIQIGQRDTLTFTHDFSIAGLAAAPVLVQMTGGNAVATLNGAGAITSIQNSTWTITGAARIDNDMTFIGTTNTITVNANSSLTLNGSVTIPDASALSMTSSTDQLIIGGEVSINEAAGDFNWDGPGTAATTVQGTGQLTLNVNRVDTTDDVYGGTLNLNDDGDVSVNNTANVWTLAGTLNKNNVGTSSVTGDAVNVTGAVVVSAGQLTMPTTTLASTSNVTVNGTMTLGGASTLAGPTAVTGTGLLRLLGTSTVTANTTINTSSFDWDGAGSGTLHTINDGVVFTINSTTLDADDAGDMDDPINVGGNGGTLAVNNVPSWTMNRTLTTNTSASGITSINGNSRMIMSGALAIWNANGQTAVNAPVTFGAGSTANIAAGGFIRLNGGDNVSVFNRIEGATINGPGTLIAINTRQLRGFGTINAPITFQNSSSLRADDGTLTIGGTINEVNTIGTADADGTLNVVNAWNSNVAANVVLNGGTLQGGAITVANANGISGRGLVTSLIVNNTRLTSTYGTLVFQTAANDNDWDGAGNSGTLEASTGGTLEIRDNATFGFGGTVIAIQGSTVYANGFGLDFNPGSSLQLNGGGTYRSTSSTDIGGTVSTLAGADSTIQVTNNFFLTFETGSATSLGGNLRLVNNNINIEAGATFSSTGGAIIVPDGSHLVADNNADIVVLLNMQGAFRPGNFEGIGRVELLDYQQADTGELYTEIRGTGLNQFDRLVVSGDAVVDGYLNIDIDEVSPGVPFVPALGQTFNIITAGAVTGQFDYYDISGMPAGLAFHVKYLANAVQLEVVNKEFFAADFDEDGDVDPTDYAIWRNAYNLNQLGDATGDNISNAADYSIWRDQLGSISDGIPGSGSLSLAAVPEPACTLLTGIALAAAACLRVGRTRFDRRRR